MKITLKPNVKPVRYKPYRLNPRYIERVKVELDQMLDAGIIEPVEESKWISSIVILQKFVKFKFFNITLNVCNRHY